MHTKRIENTVIRVHTEQYKRLKKIAKKNGLTLSEALKSLLDFVGK